ncbi:MAG: hypothetical protein LLF94_01985 [Chlamydiales bacterium]|nr:hypothetical protein [Chlamydiales bacterium]
MGMHVIKTSFESKVHNICADLMQREITAISQFSIGSVVKVPVFAITARVVAATAQAFWIVKQTIHFFPHMIGIGVGLAMSEKATFSRQYFQRAAGVYGLYFKTLGAQMALGSVAILAPEISHNVLELHKSLFSLQIEAFLQTLPDLPHVQKDIRKGYAPIDSVVHLYRRLGLPDEDWRDSLRMTIQNAYQSDPHIGAKYLSTDSKELREAFMLHLFYFAACRLNDMQKKGQFTKAIVEDLHPDIWWHMKDFLEPETKARTISHLKEVVVDYEVNPYFLYAYKNFTGFNFRKPETTQVLNLLLAKMGESRDVLIATKKFTIKQIENYETLSEITLDGIVRMFDASHLLVEDPTTIVFTTAGKTEVTFNHSWDFFGAQKLLVQVKQALNQLDAAGKAELYAFCLGHSAEGASLPVKDAINLLQKLKGDVIDKKMNITDLDDASKIEWHRVFTVNAD